MNVANFATIATENVANMENAFTFIDSYNCGMLSEWLKSALKEAGISQSNLAESLTDQLGKSIDRAAVNKMLKGTRSISAEELIAIEKITGMSAPSTILVPLKGWVGAGQSIEAVDSGDSEFVDAPTNANPKTVAVKVSGDSMHPVFEEGTLLYYSRHLPPGEMINRRCVVQLQDGRIFVKVLRSGSEENLWNLQSLNSLYPDIENVNVEWAAPIDWTKQKY